MVLVEQWLDRSRPSRSVWRKSNTNSNSNSDANSDANPDANSGRGVTEQHARSTSYSDC